MNQAPSILLADDEELFLSTTAALLRGDGYRCDCAADADQAIERLRLARYDLLVTDVKMPGNRNLRLVREAQNIAPAMPVILVTGYPSVDSAVSSIHLPVVAYLTKPVDYDDLKSHVRAAIGQSHVYRTIAEIREHLEECARDLKAVEQRKHAPTVPRKSVDVSTFTIRTLAECLSELLRLHADAVPGRDCPDLCELLDCPQRPVLRDALRKTTDILEKTRAKFKSKQLRDLRVGLESLLEKPGNLAPTRQTVC